MAINNFTMLDVFPSGTLHSHYVNSSWLDGKAYDGIFIPYYNSTDSAPVNLGFISYNYDTRKDPREFTFSILESVYRSYSDLNTNEKPTKFSMNKSTVVINETTQRVTYTVTADLNVNGVVSDVVDEPA